MPGVSKIVYKEKEIIYVDYQGCSDENEMIGIFRQAAALTTNYPNGIPVLINSEGVYQTPNFLREAGKIGKQTQPYVTKRAIVGIKSPASLIL